MDCRNCGEEMNNESLFCNKCEEKLEDETKKSMLEQGHQLDKVYDTIKEPEKESIDDKSNIVLIIGVVIILSLLIGRIAAGIKADTYEKETIAELNTELNELRTNEASYRSLMYGEPSIGWQIKYLEKEEEMLDKISKAQSYKESLFKENFYVTSLNSFVVLMILYFIIINRNKILYIFSEDN